MKIGIICEYNPFHNGHIYHINKIKELYPDSTIVLVVDSYFTERGDISVLDKFAKTEIALANNVDLVVELPFVFAIQSADIFAKGAISILNKLNVDLVVFGSESNDIEGLKKAAAIQINNNSYDSLVKSYLQSGSNYPTALAKALDYFNQDKFDTPNDLLGISYIKAIMVTNSKIKPLTIQRTNNYHDLTLTNISSASAIRNAINDKNDISNSVPSITKNFIRYVDEKKWFNYLKFKIISDLDYLNQYQTVDEGIENRIKKFIYDSNSLEELILNVKSKRFTYSKIKRMFTHILCGFKKEDAKDLKIEYIRVLGFNKSGQKVLNSVKKDLDVPIYFNYKEGLNKYFDLEFKTSVIYSLIVSDQSIVKKEFKAFPIKK